jgi:hypothetical protein
MFQQVRLKPTLPDRFSHLREEQSINHSDGNAIEYSVSPFRFRICIVSALVR